MIEIDGSMGEGGGQIVRSAVALAALTGKECRIVNIRARRPMPGLAPQHLAAVKGVGNLCGARIEGLKAGSTSILFSPGKIEGGTYYFDVGTAGSVTLVLQACLLPAMFGEEAITIRVRGGTNVRWSPPVDYYSMVLLPLLNRMGVRISLRVISRGFYPEGGGEVEIHIEPSSDLLPLDIPERGEFRSIRGLCFSQNLPDHVCKRISHSAKKALMNIGDVSVNVDRRTGPSTGAGILLAAEFENTLMGADSLGEKGVPSEQVGKQAAMNLIRELEGGGTLDVHAADQLLPYMALANGPSRFLVRELTGHVRTQIDLIPMFIETEISVKRRGPSIEISVLPNRT